MSMYDETEPGGFSYWRFPRTGRTWRVERFKAHDTAEACLLRNYPDASALKWEPIVTVSHARDGRAAEFRTRGAVRGDLIAEAQILFFNDEMIGIARAQGQPLPEQLAEADTRK